LRARSARSGTAFPSCRECGDGEYVGIFCSHSCGKPNNKRVHFHSEHDDGGASGRAPSLLCVIRRERMAGGAWCSTSAYIQKQRGAKRIASRSESAPILAWTGLDVTHISARINASQVVWSRHLRRALAPRLRPDEEAGSGSGGSSTTSERRPDPAASALAGTTARS